jgi:hypothetical protein
MTEAGAARRFIDPLSARRKSVIWRRQSAMSRRVPREREEMAFL